MNSEAINWLLRKDQPSVRYFTMKYLLDMDKNDGEVQEARDEIYQRGWASEILSPERRRLAGFWCNRVLA